MYTTAGGSKKSKRIRDISLTKKVLILVTIPLLFEIGLVGFMLQLTQKLSEARQAEAHSREIILHIDHLIELHLMRVIALLLEHTPTHDNGRSDMIESIKQEAYKEAAIIDRICRDSPDEYHKWQVLRGNILDLGESFRTVALDYASDNREVAIARAQKLRAQTQALFQHSHELSEQQKLVQSNNHEALERYNEQLQWALYICLFSSVALALSAALYFNYSTARRLKALMTNTNRLAAGQAPQKPLRGNDELAQIDKTYYNLHKSIVHFRQRERAVLDNAADIICSIDTDLRFSDINKTVTKLWGFPEESLIGSRVAEVIHPENLDGAVSALRNSITRESEVSFEARVNRADGTVADTNWVVVFSRDDNALYCVVHDITERKRVEKLKQDFVSMVSHDLRSPLTSIQMVLSLLKEDGEGLLMPESMRGIQQAENSVGRLIALVNNLLDLDRMEAGRMTISPRDVNVRQVVNDAVSAISGMAMQKNINFQCQMDDNLAAFFDYDRVAQVIVNLLANAIKFSPAQATITIAASRNKDFVAIRVVDQGRGVPAEMREAIFDRFKQVKASDATVEKGSGLGLAICKAIVERHHGRIGVEPNPGNGSIFWFTMPSSRVVFETRESENDA